MQKKTVLLDKTMNVNENSSLNYVNDYNYPDAWSLHELRRCKVKSSLDGKSKVTVQFPHEEALCIRISAK